MNKKSDISYKEAELLRFIENCQSLGFTPTYREMTETGIASSTATVNHYVNELERFGYVLRDGHRARRIRVLKHG